MTPQLWIGCCFTAVLVLFLMITYFTKDTSSSGQYNTLRFLTALCTGFAGGFFTGDALFRADWQMANGARMAISGTAGCALFFAVWFSYPKRPGIEPLRDRVILSVMKGWTFEQTARAIVKVARAIIHFEGFSAAQLASRLEATDIDAPGVVEALNQLRYQSSELPPYNVVLENGVYHVRV